MKVQDATRPLRFRITWKHVERAKQLDKKHCVVAQALKDHTDIKDVNIGATFATVEFTSGSVLRYKTPPVLRTGLNHWDKTNDWKLPEGDYALDVVPPSLTKEAIKERAKVSVFKQSFKREKGKHTINPRHIEFLRKKNSSCTK